MGNPIPEQSAPQVRDAFGRMNMDDAETVALIGGGHAFGKTHGACPLGAGPSPKEDPSNPWPGRCGTGRGIDTFTSGFEGPWTTTPNQWGNHYFTELLSNNWQVHVGPGGHHQWKTANGPQSIMMLTTDISLLHDPRYQQIIRLYASDLSALNNAFSHAWYKLTTRDMGPVTRCTGPWVPPPQPFQYPLPPPASQLPDFSEVREVIKVVMQIDATNILTPDYYNGTPYYGGVFVQLAWQCSSTFRKTDYLGGCNGARIRFSPQADWPMNLAMNRVLDLLRPVYEVFDNLSWADLIVLAGNVALDRASKSTPMSFCGGRTDAKDGDGSVLLQPNGNFTATVRDMRNSAKLMGLTDREMVVLSGRLRSAAQMGRYGFSGSWTSNPTLLSNQYFVSLLSETWEPFGKNGQYKAKGKDLYMLQTDLNLKWDASFLAIAQDFASDNSLFLQEFASAWTKLMNIDRFDGPTGNVCA